jgi:hypothetical protein
VSGSDRHPHVPAVNPARTLSAHLDARRAAGLPPPIVIPPIDWAAVRAAERESEAERERANEEAIAAGVVADLLGKTDAARTLPPREWIIEAKGDEGSGALRRDGETMYLMAWCGLHGSEWRCDLALAHGFLDFFEAKRIFEDLRLGPQDGAAISLRPLPEEVVVAAEQRGHEAALAWHASSYPPGHFDRAVRNACVAIPGMLAAFEAAAEKRGETRTPRMLREGLRIERASNVLARLDAQLVSLRAELGASRREADRLRHGAAEEEVTKLRVEVERLRRVDAAASSGLALASPSAVDALRLAHEAAVEKAPDATSLDRAIAAASMADIPARIIDAAVESARAPQDWGSFLWAWQYDLKAAGVDETKGRLLRRVHDAAREEAPAPHHPEDAVRRG